MATAGKKTTARRGGSAKQAARPRTRIIHCDACLEIAQAEALLGEVRAALEKSAPVAVDASRVETITTPCMQVFCALAEALRERDAEISWRKPSARFLEVVEMLGLRAQLGLPTEG